MRMQGHCLVSQRADHMRCRNGLHDVQEECRREIGLWRRILGSYLAIHEDSVPSDDPASDM